MKTIADYRIRFETFVVDMALCRLRFPRWLRRVKLSRKPGAAPLGTYIDRAQNRIGLAIWRVIR